MAGEHRIRIDPILVNKFQRVPGAINEVGVKIVRDLGLRYAYDKHSQNLDIIGPHPEILNLAIETLRFWVEEDDYPNTGITCQVGYPNKCMVIWRYHGDYAKKLDHLFSEDIAKLKKIPTVNVKAVPSKRNPEYVEIYCHFTVYDQVKDEIIRLSSELSRVSEDDFFVPYSDCMKARRFARSRANDGSILYALKEYPDRNRVRVWIFGREHIDVIRAKKDWIQHVGNISNDTEFKETIIRDGGVNTARFYGHPSASTSRDSFSPGTNVQQNSYPAVQQHSYSAVRQNSPRSKHTAVTVTSKNLSVSRKSDITTTSNRNSKKSGVKIPAFDNRNFPRPTNFVYPVDRQTVPEPLSYEDLAYQSNPFNLDELNDITEETRTGSPENAIIGQSGWEKGIGTKYPSKRAGKLAPNRIYVHYQVNDHHSTGEQQGQLAVKQMVHPETNLMAKDRYKTRHSERILTSVTDPKLAPAVKRNKNMRPGAKKQLQPKVLAFTRQKPVLEHKKAQNIRYHINVNGLDIYMYKHNLAKLNDMDAIVNVASGEIKPGGHLAANILDMAGPQVADEIRVYLNIYGTLRVAENMVSSAGRLPVLGVIHVAGPIWENYLNISEEECARDLHKAIYGSLKTAEKHKYRKVGMPVISSEPFFGVPKDLVAEVYVKALVDYSMGMGPLYPVLEIHLVDTDIEMLTYIKDAYEKWATDYNMVEMTQHIKSHLPSQQELSERAQSAVTLKELPAHRSENMVTFTEQSYTADGNQKWTFDVLKKLVVHVYTGSIVRLREVEAIACGVSDNLKGSLAKQVVNVGGMSYEVALKRARGNRDLIEGDVLVSEAGNLATDLVMHSIVTQPIHKINEKNLVRLDRIYSQVLQAANKLGIESLAMPLIGTGRLRQKFEVEQCSLQLIDNVIELCLSQGKSLKIRELHLVNVNTVMTQSLTQALRTRAHTKLRIESDPQPPSRQEVLSLPEQMMQTQELQKALLSARKPTETDLAEEFKHLADMQRNDKRRKKPFKTVEEMNNAIMSKARSEKTTALDDKVTESVTIEKDTLKSIEDKTGKKQQTADKLEDGKSAPNEHTGKYLSKENLQEHERMLSNAAAKDESPGEEEVNGTTRPDKPTKPDKPHKPKREKKDKIRQGDKPAEEAQNGKLFKPVNTRKRKRLPPLTGLVPQSSRAESYRSIYIRRQKLAAEMIKEQQIPIRRTHSATDVHHNADERDEFRNKTTKKFKTKPVKGGDDEDFKDKLQREKFQRDTNNYFTRGTKDRYNCNRTEFRTDMPTAGRIVSKTEKNVTESLPRNRGYATERIGMDKKATQKHVKERVLWDKEREDMYMKEMDLFALATNEAKQTHESQNAANEDLSGTDDKFQKQTENDKNKSRLTDNGVNGHINDYEGDRYIEGDTESSDIMPGSPKNIETSRYDRKNSFEELDLQKPSPTPQKPTNATHMVNTTPPEELQENEIMTLHMTKREPSAIAIQANDTMHAQPASNDLQLFNQNPDTMHAQPASNDWQLFNQNPDTMKPYEEFKDDDREATPTVNHKSMTVDTAEGYKTTEQEKQRRRSSATKSGIARSAATNSTKSKPVKLVISSELFSDKNEKTRRPGDVNVDTNVRTSAKTTTSGPNALQSATPRAEDVVIRDKLTVEIDVGDNTRESSNVTKEKAKIKRFWEVVGGKDVLNDTDIYGDADHGDGEKVLMTRVKKERKMSAKSKNSQQTDGTNVTSQKIGKYNVTLEVV